MPYTTRQQQAILNCIQHNADGCVTAQQLSRALHDQGLSVGLATVYRQLEKLSTQGRLHKISTEGGVYYQVCTHCGADCFLLKCEGCGRIVHLDCHQLAPLYQHVEEAHHFRINPRKTMLYGLCQLCSGKETT